MIDMHTHLWPTGQSPGYMKDYLDKKKKEGINLPLTGPDPVSYTHLTLPTN